MGRLDDFDDYGLAVMAILASIRDAMKGTWVKRVAYLDSYGCVITVDPSEVEQGPLRGSDLTHAEHMAMPPHWAWMTHGLIPYETRSDHRAKDGSIVPRGTACLARRTEEWVVLECVDGRVVQLDGIHYALPSPHTPIRFVA